MANERKFYRILGFCSGVLNGLFGAGGGMIAAPMLQQTLEPRKAHATSVAIILPLSALSAAFYFTGSRLSLSAVVPYLPLGLVGALLGAKFLKRISGDLLRRIFGVIILCSAVRLLLA